LNPPLKAEQTTRLIPDNSFNIRHSLRLASDHVAAFSVTLRHIFVNAVIPPYKFGKTEIAQFTVAFLRPTDAGAGHDFPNHAFAARADRERRIIHRLSDLENMPPLAGFIQMFVFVSRHFEKGFEVRGQRFEAGVLTPNP
jgi:hypothetical protein